MNVLVCPRCQQAQPGPAPVASAWLACAQCGHRWLPVFPTATGSPDAPPPAPRTAASAPLRAVPAPPRPVAAEQPLPVAATRPEIPEPPAKPLTVALPAEGGRAVGRHLGSDEYRPDETSELKRRTKALTERREGTPPSYSPGRLQAQPGAARPAPAPVSSSGASAEPVDADLFERMEQQAVQARSVQDTVAQASRAAPMLASSPALPPPPATPLAPQSTAVPIVPPAAGPVVARQVACPVCGHRWQSTRGDGEQQGCPQCLVTFNIARGQVVAGAPRIAGHSDPLLGRALRGCLIDRKLGEGGMGAVYHARQLSLDRSVAVKVLPPELARNKNFIQRFEREAKSLARINHANILHIYDFGEDQALGIYFMIIEYVEGRDLGEILHEQYTLGQIEVLDIVRQASLGLEQAAEKGVIHRDIKPDNLMLTADGLCKVSDFGLAKGYGAEKDVTSIGVRVGTPAFMSPEQCDGVDVDFRSDIYNLGCTAFLALTGHLPFDADTPFAIMLKHKNDPVPSPLLHNPNLHPRVASLVMRMLAKRPADRFATLKELIDLVEELEVSLAGTTAILRKVRGPYRPMGEAPDLAHARLTSQGARGPASPPPLRRPPTPVPPAPVVARPAPPPVTLGSPEDVPDWLKPVAVAATRTPLPSAPPVENASAAASGPSGFRDLRAKLAEARSRTLAEEAGAVAEQAGRLLEQGDHEAAAQAYERAATIAPAGPESKRLEQLATNVRRRSGRRRALRRWLVAGLVVALAGVGTWGLTPQIHEQLAASELEPIQAVANTTARVRQLEQFAADYGKPWEWYVTVFQRGYVVPSAERALREAAALHRALQPPPVHAPTPTPPPAEDPDLTALRRAAQDDAVPWREIAERAKALVGRPVLAERAAVQALLDQANREVLAMGEDFKPIEAAWVAGHQGEAADLAIAFRAKHPRAGVSTPTLVPGRLVVTDADTGALPAGVQVATQAQAVRGQVTGMFTSPGRLLGDDLRFCRSTAVAVRVEVSAPGYRSEVLVVPANTSANEISYPLALHPGIAWQHPLPGSPVWQRLELLPDGSLLACGAAALVHLRAEDGSTLATLAREQLPVPIPPGLEGHWTDWFDIGAGHAIAGTTDGVAVRLDVPDLSDGVIVHRGRNPVLAYRERELVLQPGRVVSYLIESTPQGPSLHVRTADKDLWTRPGLKGFRAPTLWFRDGAVALLDDQTLTVLDELTGQVAATLAVGGPLSAAPVLLGEGAAVLVPTAGGVQLLVLPTAAGMPIASLTDPALTNSAGATLAAQGDQVLIARADRSVHLLHWTGDHFEQAWAGTLPDGLGARVVMRLGAERAVIADEAGEVVLMARGDGSVQRRIAHGSTPLCAPLVAGGMLVIADRDGRLTAYALPQGK